MDFKSEIEKIREKEHLWLNDIQNQQVENFRNLLAFDAIFMIDDLPIIEGKEAVLKAQLDWYSDTSIEFSTFQTEILEIQISSSGDLAYLRGKEQYNQNKVEGIQKRSNKYVDIWKKVDGEWKAVVVIGNSDNP